MAARSKGRAKFDFRGRQFVWWVDGDKWLRIASSDKQFVVAVPLVKERDDHEVLVIHGPEFPGLPANERRPVVCRIPSLSQKSFGSYVGVILDWSFDPNHEIIEVNAAVSR